MQLNVKIDFAKQSTNLNDNPTKVFEKVVICIYIQTVFIESPFILTLRFTKSFLAFNGVQRLLPLIITLNRRHGCVYRVSYWG